MTSPPALAFESPDLFANLELADAATLDSLDFGIIGFDQEGVVRRYNTLESELSGLSMQRVVGFPLFTVVAPCMNNFLVAQRFDDAAEEGRTLDVIIDYVFTLRMRPRKVKLRLLSVAGAAMRYVVVLRPA